MVESTLVTGSTSRYAPPDAYLPQPWIALIAEATGHIFYWNPESNITQYEKPLPLPPIGPGSLHELPAAPPPSRSSEPKEIQQATFAAAIEAYKKQHEVTVLVGCRTFCMIDSEWKQHMWLDGVGFFDPGFDLECEIVSGRECPRAAFVVRGGWVSDSIAWRGKPAVGITCVCSCIPPENTNCLKQGRAIECLRLDLISSLTFLWRTFMSLNIDSWEFMRWIWQLQKAGFSSPTPIQAQSWPIAMQSKDVVAVAKTGSGKTLGYLVPAFLHLASHRNNSRKGPTALVLAPTRELVMQIHDECAKFGTSSDIVGTVRLL